MADSLSVLGAAVGVTSLIVQITDECFKFYHEAANLPENYRYLRVRIQIEQQRFLNFSLEAGILYADGVICGTLQINRHLLIAVLAETKVLLENYADTNGKYEKLVVPADVVLDNYKEPGTDLMGLLCLPPEEKSTKGRVHSASKKVESLECARKLGNAIAQTGRSLRTITVEPKRLLWAAVDKESFENLILKLEKLNSFLIALLDSSQLRRLQDIMNTNYLEILQLRNDVVSLTTLVKALTPIAANQQTSLYGNLGSENSPLSQTVTEETATQERTKKYLKQLVEIKIQSTRLSQLNSKTMGTLDFQTPLVFAKGTFEDDTPQQRTSAMYQGGSVWIEWKDVPANNELDPQSEQIGRRIGLLTDLLRSVKPDGFRAPPCLGCVKVVDSDYLTRFGIVFERPPTDSAQSNIVTLRDLLGQNSKPSLSRRMSLCAVVAHCIHSFHAVNWLHRALRADNIVFFSSPGPPDLSAPFVSGFELSRPSIIDQMTEKPAFDPSKDIYRHPNTQCSQTDGNYRKSYDIYSLGVVLIEIALWQRIEDIVGYQDLSKVKPRAIREMQLWLLGKSVLPLNVAKTEPYLQQVASACGDTFRNVTERCLEADTVEKPKYCGEQDTAIALRLQKVTEQDIVKKLEFIAGGL